MWGGGFNRDEGKSYRLGYPNQKDDLSENDMLQFYKGEISSKPSGDFIDNIHRKWFGDYYHLEAHHGYIQWIFPIREEGVNGYAGRLQYHELKQFREDPIIRARVIKSYEMMLDFYGMVLKDRETGELERNPDTWESRYRHLNSSFHNYLRISRILKALGEFGFERFKHHWIDLFLNEIIEHGQLKNTTQSLQRFWIATLRNKDERIERKNRLHQFLKQKDTDDEGDDRGDNPDFQDISSPPPMLSKDDDQSESESTTEKQSNDEAGSEEEDSQSSEKSKSSNDFNDSKTSKSSKSFKSAKSSNELKNSNSSAASSSSESEKPSPAENAGPQAHVESQIYTHGNHMVEVPLATAELADSSSSTSSASDSESTESKLPIEPTVVAVAELRKQENPLLDKSSSSSNGEDMEQSANEAKAQHSISSSVDELVVVAAEKPKDDNNSEISSAEKKIKPDGPAKKSKKSAKPNKEKPKKRAPKSSQAKHEAAKLPPCDDKEQATSHYEEEAAHKNARESTSSESASEQKQPEGKKSRPRPQDKKKQPGGCFSCFR